MSNMYQRKTASSYGQPSNYGGSGYSQSQSTGGYGQSQSYGQSSQQSYGGYGGGGEYDYGGGYGSSTASPTAVSGGSVDSNYSSSLPSSSKKKHSSSSNNKNFSPLQSIKSNPWYVCFIVALFLSTTTIYNGRKASSLQTVINQLEEEHTFKSERESSLTQESISAKKEATTLQRRLNEMKDSNRKLEEKIRRLEKENSEAVKKVTLLTDEHGEKLEKSEVREDALWDRIDLLTERIVRENLRELTERFGKGPHRVQFNVEFPPNKTNKQPTMESFVVELAPITLMPHSVHLFLEMVYHNLWDGCSFVINAPHILQAGPHDKKEDGTINLSDEIKTKFNEMKLDMVYFQEYHEEYPHKRYTLGFAGRPGGPDFYINTMNNVENHGPGGQLQHSLSEEADPCFGEVVEGMEVIEKMRALPTGSDTVFKNPVTIVSARIISEINILPYVAPAAAAADVEEEENKKKVEEEKKGEEVQKNVEEEMKNIIAPDIGF